MNQIVGGTWEQLSTQQNVNWVPWVAIGDPPGVAYGYPWYPVHVLLCRQLFPCISSILYDGHQPATISFGDNSLTQNMETLTPARNASLPPSPLRTPHPLLLLVNVLGREVVMSVVSEQRVITLWSKTDCLKLKVKELENCKIGKLNG